MRRFVSLSVLVVAASASIATSKKKTLPKADVQTAGDLHVPGEAQVDLQLTSDGRSDATRWLQVVGTVEGPNGTQVQASLWVDGVEVTDDHVTVAHRHGDPPVLFLYDDAPPAQGHVELRVWSDAPVELMWEASAADADGQMSLH